MSAAADDFVPDMQRRTIMNLVLLGGAGVPVLWLGGGFIYFLVPPSGGGDGGGVTARDALGADVLAAKWISSNPYPSRALVEGLKGDAHYLIVKEDKTLENYAINAVCTLLCPVPSHGASSPDHRAAYESFFDPATPFLTQLPTVLSSLAMLTLSPCCLCTAANPVSRLLLPLSRIPQVLPPPSPSTHISVCDFSLPPSFSSPPSLSPVCRLPRPIQS
jgi:hypothetical protein